MNVKQYEISTHSRYSWTNLHVHNFVPCRKCNGPLLPTEFTAAISEVGKIVVAKLPDRCGNCVSKKKEKSA